MSDTASTPGVFDRAFDITVGHEGDGLDRTYGDPGNWTGGAVGNGLLNGSRFGISAAAYPALDIAGLTRDDAKGIYHGDYWARIRGDELPAALAVMAFDAAVNNGVARAIRWMQAAAAVTEDGEIGHETLDAIARLPLQRLMNEFHAQRINFMAGLPTWRMFGLGWARRLAAIPFQAIDAAR